jgi:hypothetical protein
MKFHPSEIGKIMTNSRLKTESLSETAKSHLRSLAKQNFYGYNSELNSKYLNKGIYQEDDSIRLLNAVRFTNYTKHQGRIISDLLTGECDILLDDLIIDIKTSWSLETFPATSEEGDDAGYEWQGRAYMHLYNRPSFELIYCMVSTDPKDEWNLLSPWDNLSIHRVDHIDPAKRVTVIRYERDMDKELMMMERLSHASEYYNNYLHQLESK